MQSASCRKNLFPMRYYTRVLLLTATALGIAASHTSQNIDYRPRLLAKVLKKYDVPGFEALQALPIPNHAPTPGKFFEITTPPRAAVKYVYIGRVNSCRAGGCTQAEAPTPEELESEYFDYFILFDPQVEIRAIRVYNYAASYGYEITAPGWLRQFVGYAGNSTLTVGKDVDAITGATVSVYAITADVEMHTRALKEWVQKHTPLPNEPAPTAKSNH